MGGGGGGPTYIPKPVSWADETDDLEGECGIPGSWNVIPSPQSSISGARTAFVAPRMAFTALGLAFPVLGAAFPELEQHSQSLGTIVSSEIGIPSSLTGIPASGSKFLCLRGAFLDHGGHSQLPDWDSQLWVTISSSWNIIPTF